MAALTWLLIPFLAAVGAGVWGSWATRYRKTGGGDGAELAGYERFRAAMERAPAPVPAGPDPGGAVTEGREGPS